MSEVYAAQQVAWPYLLHVVQVLHAWRLPQVDAMSYVLTQHEGTDQMICVTSLPYSTQFSLGTQSQIFHNGGAWHAKYVTNMD